MTWHILQAHNRIDDRVVAKARAEGRKFSRADMKHLGPEWWGADRRLNPLHATRPRAFLMGGWLVGIFLLTLLAWRSGLISTSSVELLAIFALLPGVAALIYGFEMPRFLASHSWRLMLDDEGLHYQPVSYWEPFVRIEGWSVPLHEVARVETGATADWAPMRSFLLRDKPTPREEVQTFLFLADGSRRVIATVHGGRESMSTLAHSIRSSLQAMRERRVRSEIATVSGEGFDT